MIDRVAPATSTTRSYNLVSLNDHVVLPPDTFTSRVPKRFGDRVPHVIEGAGVDAAGFLATRGVDAREVLTPADPSPDPDGPGDAWCYDGKIYPTSITSVSPEYQDFDVRHIGSFHYRNLELYYLDARARAEVMSAEGILASAVYPMVDFPSYAGLHLLGSDDRDLAAACVRAYNDFVLEEWAGACPGVFIPLVVLPLWDPVAASVEIHRVAGLGAKGITFPEDPAKVGLGAIHGPDWDPVFAAAQETGLPLFIHNASSLWMPPVSKQASVVSSATMLASIATMTFFDWIFSSAFVRFPSLRIVQNECDIGWIPWALQRSDMQWERNRAYRGRWNTAPPSTAFGKNMFACALPYETDTAQVIEQIGPGGVMFETDYPHLDMSYPHTQSMLKSNLETVPDAALEQILRGNATRLFSLTPQPVPA